MAGRAVGCLELARELGFEQTRVNRLLKTLAHLGLTHQDASRKYSAGPGMHVLAAQSLFGSGLIQKAIRPLQALSEYKLVVALGVLWRDQVAYLYHASQGVSPAEALGRVGLFPAIRSAIGLALLAHRPESEVREIFKGRGGVKALLGNLKASRRDGFALVHPFPSKTEQSLGVPLGEQPFAAIAFSGTIKKSRIPKLLQALQNAVAEISSNSTHPTQPITLTTQPA